MRFSCMVHSTDTVCVDIGPFLAYFAQIRQEPTFLSPAFLSPAVL